MEKEEWKFKREDVKFIKYWEGRIKKIKGWYGRNKEGRKENKKK